MLIRVGELMVAQIIGKIFHFARFFQLFILKWEDCICREKKKDVEEQQQTICFLCCHKSCTVH